VGGGGGGDVHHRAEGCNQRKGGESKTRPLRKIQASWGNFVWLARAAGLVRAAAFIRSSSTDREWVFNPLERVPSWI